jgi:hypothetical protein
MAYKTRKPRKSASKYHVVTGKTRRVMARTRTLATARKRAAALTRRGSKHVSIMKTSTGGPRKRRRSTGRRTSARRTSRRAAPRRRSSRRRSSVRKNRRSSRRKSRRNSRRRSSRRRSSRS